MRVPRANPATANRVRADDLTPSTQRLLQAGLAASTRSTYRAGVNKFLHYCEVAQVKHRDRLPAPEHVLANFVGSIATSVSPGTIRVYLSAIRAWHIDHGYADPLVDALLLERCVRGARRLYSRPRRTRLPFTANLLRKIWPVQVDQGWNDVLFRATVSLGFFGFLRLGEFALTNIGTSFDPLKHACLSDLTFHYNNSKLSHAAFTIKVSKTDPFRCGSTVHIGATGNRRCPVKALLDYTDARRLLADAAADESTVPLFCQADMTPLSKPVFVSMMTTRLQRAGVDSTGYSGHSLRIGAATSAAAAGVPDWLIKVMGRWRSDAYQRYVHTPLKNVLEIAPTLATCSVTSSTPIYST